MTHLGSWISALVDGQLDPAATERALAHVAVCRQCADELEAARAARRALAGADPVQPTEDLTARLLSLGGSCRPVPPPTARDPFAVPLAGHHVRAHALPRVAGTLRGDVVSRRSPVRLVAGSVAGVGAVAAMLFVLGARPVVQPTTSPALALGLLAEADRTAEPGQALTQTAVSRLSAQGWALPTGLPGGWEVSAVRWTGDDAEVLEVDLVGPGGTVVVTEQQGVLDASALAGVPVETVGGRDVHVLSYEPWQGVWQADGTVVQVVSTAGEDEVAAVVAAFGTGEYDDTVPGRIGRGWQTVTGAWGDR
ncbi:zf-HC2 domain-containing protein [Cellulomonas sp. SLBN-39]|uniref:zf-HC2 domain-containing protein n=1 Tax=Cellulomonas sp. SLBN-39 TaxID=2768446 RepID=UPI0011528148|nr:zf-HC2 domain-containing protein [Cellulomonas sp. SLBN-39]TQL01327.1 putative zinc finger protein [Cellulomonas sp. SLBN-39]